jgi:hypothetical protein
MSRFFAAFATLALIATISVGTNSAASADSWGCSYEKCLVACAKAGGKYCTAYCSQQLKDKQLAKICK